MTFLAFRVLIVIVLLAAGLVVALGFVGAASFAIATIARRMLLRR